jgi:hypothetical protein
MRAPWKSKSMRRTSICNLQFAIRNLQLASASLQASAALACVAAALVCSVAHGAPYVAAFVDGTRVEGKAINDWFIAGKMPLLDGTPLLDEKRPLRWLLDQQPLAAPPTQAAGVLELVGGDRLPVRSVEVEPAGSPAWGQKPLRLLVKPAVSVDCPGSEPRSYIRVNPQMVRRLAWRPRAAQPIPPGALVFRDGRQITFQSLRWEPDAVRVLMEEGIRKVPWGDLADVHLPCRDAWKLYEDELAVLSPDCIARLVRMETSDGLIVTTSVPGVWAMTASGPDIDVSDRKNWYQLVEPAWSDDPLWVPFNAIRTRVYFAADEVPLARLTPSKAVERPILGKGLSWRLNASVLGGPLASGERLYGWGFGVQAANELWFDLPACARAFQSRVGLDRLAGPGGCVRAAVYANRPGDQPLFRSKILVGTGETVDTGALDLRAAAGAAKSLVLVADPVLDDAPPGTDPLDIRDSMDWFDPLLLVDRQKLHEEMRRGGFRAIPAWAGWTPGMEGGGPVPLELRWDEPGSPLAHAAWTPATGKRALTLSQQRSLAAADRFLLLEFRPLVPEAAAGQVEVRIDGAPIARCDARGYGPGTPVAVPLDRWRGRRVKLEVAYLPADERQRIEWQTLSVLERTTRVPWVTLPPLAVRWGAEDAVLSPQPDGSLLASGGRPQQEVYTVTAAPAAECLSALRLEALTDPSLPAGGPGRDEGRFLLSRLGLRVLRCNSPLAKGRFVRVDLPGQTALLSLAEVQVFAEGKNVALAGKATQSSDSALAPGAGPKGYPLAAQRAIDGNTDGNMAAGSVAETRAEPNPWWEVDLGESAAIDYIVVWNRTDGGAMGRQMKNFRLAVLDATRKTVWETRATEPPHPAQVFCAGESVEIPLKSAAADYSEPGFPVADCLRGPGNSPLSPGGRGAGGEGERHPPPKPGEPPRQGWSIRPQVGKPHLAVFEPEQPVDLHGALLVITLEQRYPPAAGQLLGRFRLSTTEQPPPVPTEPVAVELPLLPAPKPAGK